MLAEQYTYSGTANTLQHNSAWDSIFVVNENTLLYCDTKSQIYNNAYVRLIILLVIFVYFIN